MSKRKYFTEEEEKAARKASANRAKAKYRASAKGKAKERETAIKYRLANLDKFAAQSAKFRALNPERARQHSAKSRSDPEKRARYYAQTRDWHGRHKEYLRIFNKKAYEANRTARVQMSVEWQRANPEKVKVFAANRRARKRAAAGKLSKDIVPRLTKLQRNKCAVCRSIFGAAGKKHLDHIVPLAAGGSNFDSNVQLLCAPCNCSKGPKDPIRFMQSRGLLL